MYVDQEVPRERCACTAHCAGDGSWWKLFLVCWSLCCWPLAVCDVSSPSPQDWVPTNKSNSQCEEDKKFVHRSFEQTGALRMGKNWQIVISISGDDRIDQQWFSWGGRSLLCCGLVLKSMWFSSLEGRITRTERQKVLLGAYGFQCRCQACDLDQEDVEREDQLRREVPFSFFKAGIIYIWVLLSKTGLALD